MSVVKRPEALFLRLFDADQSLLFGGLNARGSGLAREMRPVCVGCLSQFLRFTCHGIVLAFYFPASTSFGIQLSVATGPSV